MNRYLGIIIAVLVLTGATFAAECKPTMALGTTYEQIKVACPDIGVQAVDFIEPNVTVYYCRSQSALVLGDVKTGKVVGLMVIDYDPTVGR